MTDRMTHGMTHYTLPHPAPAPVLAVGAWLKNRACLLRGTEVLWSEVHGDLSSPTACEALAASVSTLLAAAGGRVAAVAHDLHPDFESTRQAVALAGRLGVPAVPVQHHHAHIGVVQAEQGHAEHGRSAPCLGLALDGVGLGSDGAAWGGELLWVNGAHYRRLNHLEPLALPGGDIAAREPWRLAAAVLHALGRGEEIVPRLGPQVGERLAAGVRTLLERDLNCPRSTAAGRWFDAVAGLLGLSVRQGAEAEAAQALERRAAQALNGAVAEALRPVPHGHEGAHSSGGRSFGEGLRLRYLAAYCLGLADAGQVGAAAAAFHLGLADALAEATVAAAAHTGVGRVALGGGCFFNRVLTERLRVQLEGAGLTVQAPVHPGPGDAGLALGQAWVAAHAVTSSTAATESLEAVCV